MVGEEPLQPSISKVAPETEPPASFTAANSPSTFTLQVSFTGLGTFTIGPDRWWSDTVIRLFEGALTQQDRDLFFGEEGVLPRRIFQVVLGFQPTLKLSFDDWTVFESARDSLQNPVGDGVGIGPFNLHSKALVPGSDGVSTYSEPDQTITIGPIQSTLPILLGVVSIALGA
jgi:hypothetical protein